LATRTPPGSALLLLAACYSSGPPAAQPLRWNAGDSAHVALLDAEGRRIAGRHVVVHVLPLEMPEVWQAALVDSLDRGIAELHRLMGAPLSWQRIGGRPVRYYLVSERMISHASGQGVVFISMFHVRNGTAPYLHEALHELLAPPPPFFYREYPDTVMAEAKFQAMPYWLMEGLPDYLAQVAAARAGTREGDVFATGGPDRADSTCAARLEGHELRSELLRTLGGRGAVDQLFTTDRIRVAPAFYACAQSLAGYLVGTIGVDRTVALFPAIREGEWIPVLERAAAVPLDTLRARWQSRLGLAGQP
jgi:hypothetical protein